MMKTLVFDEYDRAVKRHATSFLDLFDNMLTSTFANPWVFLKGATVALEGDHTGEVGQDAENRIPKEIQSRSGIEVRLSKWLNEVPTEAHMIDDAVDKVQMLVLKIYSFIRSQVCDQVELFAESFFKLPMLRRLEEDMAMIELSGEDEVQYQAR